jgi:hypothetical protein
MALDHFRNWQSVLPNIFVNQNWGHSLYSRNMQSLFSRSQTIILMSSDARLRGVFITSTIKSTFWCIIHTQTEWVPAAPAS